MKKRAISLLLLSFLGLVDTLYLGIKRGTPVPCSITTGCEEVLNSSFSTLAGIPISWFGFAFYLAVFSAAAFSVFSDEDRLLKWIFWPALAAFVISIGLVAVQAFILRAYCQYCLVSAILTTLIFFGSPRPGLRRMAQET
ncbi:MAG TPA: vitamin K epoxide reductase family protein [Terriglobia bacterium]|nr:vitamin K epoxide reductase family protein [Terriglobia bacterium]